ncbi:hypothetical protein CDL12_02343 [Handroanthus impetiginosus]|uniref:Uncharacterized protein n=1 Tax=Handroanthus impetiginosus TaxID=429701 RepID=A0A2G9I574_9LAMI|nr:hypothetical protein CDL12_02343 [Handroanthus impetiginosus]
MDCMDHVRILIVIYALFIRTMVCVCLLYVASFLRAGEGRRRRLRTRARWSMISRLPDQLKHIREMVELSDQACIHNVRMDRGVTEPTR